MGNWHAVLFLKPAPWLIIYQSPWPSYCELVFQAGNIRSVKPFYCMRFIKGTNFTASVKFQVKEIIKPKNKDIKNVMFGICTACKCTTFTTLDYMWIGPPCNVCIHISPCVTKSYSSYSWLLDSYVIHLRTKPDLKDHYVLVGNGNNHRFYLSSTLSGESSPAPTCLPFAKGVPFVSSGAIFTSKSFRFCPSTLTGDSLLGRYLPVVPSMVN